MPNIAEKIREIYRITSELEKMYPGRHFTPDGHMVGSIGEVIAAEEYGLELFKASHPVHDAETKDGRPVQIKATQGDGIAIGERPELLIVLKIHHDGSFEEVYNGPGDVAWRLAGKRRHFEHHVDRGLADGFFASCDRIVPFAVEGRQDHRQHPCGAKPRKERPSGTRADPHDGNVARWESATEGGANWFSPR